MRARLVNFWDRMTGSYWFVPSAFILFALFASLAFPYLDRRFGGAVIEHATWLRIVPDSARTLLSTIAGVMATVLSLVFSLTILTLSIAASQFGPRLLRSFLNNHATQVALGTFVATALYALVVLATIRGGEDWQFVPHFSVYAGIAAAVFNLIYLIHFVQTIADLIQAPNVVLRVARDLEDSIHRLCPACGDEGTEKSAQHCDSLPPCIASVPAQQEGYVQGIDTVELTEYAKQAGGVIRLRYRPGQFLCQGMVLADFHGEGTCPDELEEAVNQCVVTGSRRTPRQDVECALLELVELAVRALSPGVNDPFTAMNCVDRLGAALGRIAQRDLPPSLFFDEDDGLRVVIPAITLADFIASAFNQIRQHGRSDTAVLMRIVEALAEVARQTRGEEDRQAVLRQVEMIERESEESIQEPNDRDDLSERAQVVRGLLADQKGSADG